jgi:hypothetical protein
MVSNALSYPMVIGFAQIISIQLLEVELGHTLPGGGFEYFAINYTPEVTFVPDAIVLKCLDQQHTVNGVANIENYMVDMNTTSSQMGLGGFGVAMAEMWRSGMTQPFISPTQVAWRLYDQYVSAWPANIKLKNPFSGFAPQIQTKGPILFLANTIDPLHSFAK